MLQDLREHQRILDEGLKSTSLIIKTMRSASEFDEAMRRLSIASLEAMEVLPSTNTAIVVPTPMLRSNSYQESSRRYSNASEVSDYIASDLLKSSSFSSSSSLATTTTTNRKFSTDSQSSFVKFLGNTQIPVSQQLTQLRRMYDAEDNDSADEEVKSYFRNTEEDTEDNSDSGGGTQESSSMDDELGIIEQSGSWSRLKAKRTLWKIEAEEQQQQSNILQRAGT